MGMMLKNLVHPYIQSTTVLCDILKGLGNQVVSGETGSEFTSDMHLE